MPEPLILCVRNKIEAIAPAKEAAEAWLAQQNASLDVTYFVSLAIEELVTNCIKYAYDDANEHVIRVMLSMTHVMLTMTVVDDGHEFDPLSAPAPDLTKPIEDRAIGGLGLHLLRELADHIIYERRNNTNRLTLTKRIS